MHVVRGDRQMNERSNHPLFTGEAYLEPLFALGPLRVNDVEFRAGARTRWHTHTFDQLLIITAGTGIVANDDGEQEVTAGDVVMVNAGERHWHGAQAGSTMKHVSVNGSGETQW